MDCYYWKALISGNVIGGEFPLCLCFWGSEFVVANNLDKRWALTGSAASAIINVRCFLLQVKVCFQAWCLGIVKLSFFC